MQLPATSSLENTVPFVPRRLLIVRLGSMGDIIHTLPAVTALRGAFPEARIGWIVEERWAELLCTLSEPRSGPRSPRRPLVDRIHTVNTKTWRKDPFSAQTWEQIAAGLSELRAQRYEVAVDFQGAINATENPSLLLAAVLGLLGQLARQMYFNEMPGPATSQLVAVYRLALRSLCASPPTATSIHRAKR